MNNFFEESLFAGIVLSLISYEIGLLIKMKLKYFIVGNIITLSLIKLKE